MAESRPMLATSSIFYYCFHVIAQHKLLVFATPVTSFHVFNQDPLLMDIRLVQGLSPFICLFNDVWCVNILLVLSMSCYLFDTNHDDTMPISLKILILHNMGNCMYLLVYTYVGLQ